MDRSQGGLLLSAQFFDKDGDIICRIRDNKFTLNRDKVFDIDQTPHALTVFDKQDRKVFVLDFVNDRAVKLLGDFFVRDGVRILITENMLKYKGFEFSSSSLSVEGGNERIIINLDVGAFGSVR